MNQNFISKYFHCKDKRKIAFLPKIGFSMAVFFHYLNLSIIRVYDKYLAHNSFENIHSLPEKKN